MHFCTLSTITIQLHEEMCFFALCAQLQFNCTKGGAFLHFVHNYNSTARREVLFCTLCTITIQLHEERCFFCTLCTITTQMGQKQLSAATLQVICFNHSEFCTQHCVKCLGFICQMFICRTCIELMGAMFWAIL